MVSVILLRIVWTGMTSPDLYLYKPYNAAGRISNIDIHQPIIISVLLSNRSGWVSLETGCTRPAPYSEDFPLWSDRIFCGLRSPAHKMCWSIKIHAFYYREQIQSDATRRVSPIKIAPRFTCKCLKNLDQLSACSSR